MNILRYIDRSKWAMVAITALVTIALIKGIDSALLGSALAILGGLGGYSIHQAREAQKADATTTKH